MPAAQDDGVAVAHGGRPELVRDDDLTDARRRDEQPVGGAALHDLGVAGDDGDARLARRGRHAGADGAQVVQGEALLDDEGGGERQRPRRRRRQVVDGAGHGEPADVAAGKPERLHHVRVGGEGDAAGRRQRGRVVQPLQHRVGERPDEDVLDEVAVQLAAAAVAEQDALAGRLPAQSSIPL